MREAPSLQPGDAVAIAAPSSSFDRQAFACGVQILKQWGLKPLYRKDIFSRHRHFAGTDRRRFQELQSYLDHPQLKAILFARGGFGLHAILPRLRFQKLKRYPKRFLGYSDLTMLLDRVRQEAALVAHYAPAVCDLGRSSSKTFQSRYRKVLFGTPDRSVRSLRSGFSVQSGRVRGRLVGGCLTLVCASIGTPFEIVTRGSLLLLEDTAEEVYRVERMLLHLKQAGKLKGVRGILLGDFNVGGIRKSRSVWRKMFSEVLGDFSGPIVAGLHFGHCPNPHLLPLGAKAEINTRTRTLSLL